MSRKLGVTSALLVVGAWLALAGVAGAAATVISEIRGTGPTIAVTGEVTVEAVVTSISLESGSMVGFYVMEEDADADADPASPEGIFVWCGAGCPSVAVGDLVEVTGTAEDFEGMARIDASAGSIATVSSGNPSPSSPTPPCAAGLYSANGLEPCGQAEPGTYVPTEAATSTIRCSLGTYQPAAGQTECLLAAVDHFVDSEGAVAQQACLPGFSQPQTGQSFCIADPPPSGDVDGDGVPDGIDVCPGTDLAGDAADTPSRWWRHWYWSDANGDFVSRSGRSSGIDVADTGGCSASQIVEELSSGPRWQRFRAQISDRYGFSRGTLRHWARTH